MRITLKPELERGQYYQGKIYSPGDTLEINEKDYPSFEAICVESTPEVPKPDIPEPPEPPKDNKEEGQEDIAFPYAAPVSNIPEISDTPEVPKDTPIEPEQKSDEVPDSSIPVGGANKRRRRG